MKKRTKRIFGGGFIVVIALLTPLIFIACSSFGTLPNDDERLRLKESRQYVYEESRFRNRVDGLYQAMSERLDYTSALWNMFTAEGTSPDDELPVIKPNLDVFLAPTSKAKVIWFGHSTFMLNINEKVVLVDPVLSDYAAPVFFFSRRWQAPPLQLEELPPVDYIVISHDHYDHLDMPSVKFFADKGTKFLVPLGVGSHLRGWGIPAENVIEQDWWQASTHDGIQFRTTPAQHFSGRNGVDQNATLWASWVIKTDSVSLFFSGDTGYDIHFKVIGDKYGPFDMAFMESGQDKEAWKEIHMLPDDWAKASADLQAKAYMPLHWGLFTLSLHPWNEPIDRLYLEHQNGAINLVSPVQGEIVEIGTEYEQKVWWGTLKEQP